MAEETAAPIASGERTDQDAVTVIDERPPQPENENVTESLFGETVTDEELMGEESTIPPPSETPPVEETKPPAETPPPASEEPKTPPPGFVPLAALHEERGKRQAMTQRMQELEASIEQLKAGEKTVTEPEQKPPQPPVESALPPDFKVLTSQEYKDLAESDVVEAQIYLYNLGIHEKEQKARIDAAEGAKRVQEQVSQLIDRRYAEMEAAVPGIFEEDSAINKALTTFAGERGLESTYLGIITDPATRIVGADGKVQILGKGAVQILSMLHNLYTGAKPDPAKDEKLKAEGAVEALNKIKDASAGYRGIGNTPPGGSSVPLDPNRVLTEAEMSKLSSEEQERYLSGT